MNDLRALLNIGVPPVKIAAHLGVSRVAVHYWQTGVCQPSPTHALQLSLLLAEIRARLDGRRLTGR
jgi:DNA-binding transcriptional regulator YdaS (Cro superfamily)